MSLKSTFSRFKGALLSGNPAAYFGMLMIACTPPGNILDKLIFRHFVKHDDSNEVPPCVLIISPPRSGSTITYQVLTRLIPSVYFSNLHAVMPSYASTRLLKKNKMGLGLKGYKNYYGYSVAWNDVNEGNDVVSSFYEGNADKAEIRRRFIAFCKDMKATKDRPLIFKNVRNFFETSRLAEAVPELKFIRIKRDVDQIIQSEYKAFEQLGAFHPIPARLEGQLPVLGPHKFAVEMILEMEKVLDEQKHAIAPENYMEWHYEDFCENTLPMVKGLMENHLNMDTSKMRDYPTNLKASRSQKVSDADLQIIRDHIKTVQA